MNEVVLARLGPASANAAIDATIARYRALRVGFKWCVGPDSAPGDLATRLERRGFQAWMCRAMVRGTTSFGRPLPAGVTVDLVGDDTLPEYAETLATGWESPREET